MKKKFINIVIILVFVVGLSLVLYPFVANKWNTYRQEQLISDYDAAVADLEAADAIDYEAEMEKATSYNDALLPSILPDSFAVADVTEDATYEDCLNITGDGMMGKVVIPKIDIELPIYHYTTTEVLENAAGHLEGSSLPVGGENTHAVISAHRGLPSAKLFTDLDQMEIGDHFLIYVLDEVLCYEVDKISVVEPEETEALAVEAGQDLVTLLTCTPYGVNTQRLLVRGHRVPYEEGVAESEQTPLSGLSLHTNYGMWVVIALALSGGIILIIYLRDRKLRKQEAAGGGTSGGRRRRNRPGKKGTVSEQMTTDSGGGGTEDAEPPAKGSDSP